MVDPAQHDDADPVLALELIQCLSGLAADLVLAVGERLEAFA